MYCVKQHDGLAQPAHFAPYFFTHIDMNLFENKMRKKEEREGAKKKVVVVIMFIRRERVCVCVCV